VDGYGARWNIPAVVHNKAVVAGAARWVRDLPEVIAGLEQDWSITVGRPYPDATEAFVAEATLADGTAAVLKLHIPRQGGHARNEITVLRLAGGDGCVQLLRADAGRSALLLERLGPALYDLGLPLAGRHEILCSAAERIWRPIAGRLPVGGCGLPAGGCGLPTGAEKGRWLADFIPKTWEELGRPCTERAVEHALACATRRINAHDDERAVLVHGDVHQWNALRAGDSFKLVDPDGLLAEAEYDMGILMREDPEELLQGDPRGRARKLAARCGLDATAIWEWGVVERVSTGLSGTQVGLQPVARQMLAAADQVARIQDSQT
jgi:streptomycin 6-kinase